MHDRIMQLLSEIDEALVPYAKPDERLDLYLLGRASLILRLHLTAVSTNDVDIVWMSPDKVGLEETAIKLFGKGTANALRLGLYLERVPQGLPPLPQNFRSRAEMAPGPWRVLRPKFLEFHDLAVSKLKRFAAKDREDLKLLCDEQLITPEGLWASLESAFTFSADEEEDSIRQQAGDACRKVCNYLETGKISF